MYVSQLSNIINNTLDLYRAWIKNVIYKTVLHISLVPVINLIVIGWINKNYLIIE